MGLRDKEIYGNDLENFFDFLASTETLTIDSDKGKLEAQVPKAIIVLGDFLDLWDGSLAKLPKFTTDYARPLTEKADLYYLRGNHDYLVPNIQPRTGFPRNKFEICEYKVLNIAGRSCFFIHGHQFSSWFGPLPLKIESYVNPYCTILEGFLSRLFWGHGRHILYALAVLFLGLCALFFSSYGTPILRSLTSEHILFLWMLIGLLVPAAIVTIWRFLQKALWKLLVLIFQDLIKSLTGAVRGDTIKYLTSRSRPISRWFSRGERGSDDARKAEFVCFGHTHIPEPPQCGEDESLREITFMNTGSWVRPSKGWADFASTIREYLRYYDWIDEYVVIGVVALIVLAPLIIWFYPRIAISPTLAMIFLALFALVEALVALGRSSYRRIPVDKVRSLVYIGKSPKEQWSAMLLYWDPQRRLLSSKTETCGNRRDR